MRLVFVSVLCLSAGLAVGAAPVASPSDIAALVERVAKLTERVEKLEAATRSSVTSTSPSREQSVATAITERRLAVGMTIAEADKALGTTGEVRSDAGDRQIYQWTVYGPPTYSGPRVPSESSGRFVSGAGYKPEPAKPEPKEPQPKRGRYSAEVQKGKIVSFTNP
jgi:hypothetical protein